MSRLRNALKSIEWPAKQSVTAPSQTESQQTSVDVKDGEPIPSSVGIEVAPNVERSTETIPLVPNAIEVLDEIDDAINQTVLIESRETPITSRDERVEVDSSSESDRQSAVASDSQGHSLRSKNPYPREESPAFGDATLSERPALAGAMVNSGSPTIEVPPGLKLRQTEPWASEYASAARAITEACKTQISSCVLLTSPEHGDGRTTLVAHLAAHLASQGHGEVLAIDASFARPGLTLALGVFADRGISDVALGWCHLTDAILQTGIRGLSVMGCGTLAKPQADALAELEVGPVLAMLRPSFRWIVIDGSLAKNADTLALSAAADAVYLVTRLGHTDRRAARRATKSLRSAGVEISGCIVTGAEAT